MLSSTSSMGSFEMCAYFYRVYFGILLFYDIFQALEINKIYFLSDKSDMNVVHDKNNLSIPILLYAIRECRIFCVKKCHVVIIE